MRCLLDPEEREFWKEEQSLQNPELPFLDDEGILQVLVPQELGKEADGIILLLLSLVRS